MINTLILFLSLITIQPDYEKELISYFIENRTEKCFVLDRQSNKKIVSVSATGFGYLAWVRAYKRGMITREQCLEWINRSVQEINIANRNNGGWVFHFLTLEGKPALNEEVSSVDSCLYYLCLRQAAKELNDDNLKQISWKMINDVDVNIMLDQQQYFHHGFFIQDGELSTLKLIPYIWDQNSEGILLYKLFNINPKVKKVRFDLPLFVYYFPLCFYDDHDLYLSLQKAIAYQTTNNQKIWGFTMCDNQNGGYSFEPGLLSPIAIYSCSRYFPAKSKQMLSMLKCSPLTCSMTVDGKWINRDKVGIDLGVALLLTGKR